MRKNLGKWLLVWPPQAYLLFFFLVPALIMLFASFRFPGDYGGLAPWMYSEDGQTVYDLSVENYTRLTESWVYLQLFVKSFGYALVTTLACLLLAYPVATTLARAPAKWRNLLILLVILPFWSNLLVRVYAWMIILSPSGALTRGINAALDLFGAQPISLMFTPFAVILCMVYVHLPFMILPLYANLEKHDPALLDAAQDLGAVRQRAVDRPDRLHPAAGRPRHGRRARPQGRRPCVGPTCSGAPPRWCTCSSTYRW